LTSSSCGIGFGDATIWRRPSSPANRLLHRPDTDETDLHGLLDDALFRPEVREAYRQLIEQGWTDALRAFHPDERIYTFWKYYRNAFGRDAGLRIDHLLLSASLAGRLVAAEVDREVRSRERASDHAPVWIELAEANAQSPRPA
jgi:exodeoxyribonuclease III